MATATALDVITASLLKLRVHRAGTAVPPEDAQDALDELNRMLETWAVDGRLVYRVLDVTKTLTPGQASYTIGPGGDINTVRPLSLQDGFTRVGTIDEPYQVIGHEVYTAIPLKSQAGPYPLLAYYDPAYPLGVVYVWPVPSGAGVLHVVTGLQFTPLADVLELLAFPPGYKDLLIYSLAKRRAPDYGAVLGAEFLDDLRRMEIAIARQNAQPVIATIRYPVGHGVTDPNWILTGGG